MSRALTDGPYFNYCIQCTDKNTGKIGDFVAERKEDGFYAISPVFDNLLDFFWWARDNGWHFFDYSKDGNTYFGLGAEKFDTRQISGMIGPL